MHGWQNSWKKGGNVAKRARQAREVPWVSGVRCQQFFPSRAASSWFEVSQEPPWHDNDHTPGPSQASKIEALFAAQKARVKAGAQARIRESDEKTEPSPWLERTGWAVHLDGLDAAQLQATADPITPEETVLGAMWKSMECVLDQARTIARARTVGRAVLFEVERKEVHVKPAKPFDGRMEDQTWARYKDTYRKLLCIWYRTQDMEEEQRPPYKLTPRQGDLYDDFEEAAKTAAEGQGAEGVGDIGKRVERLCLDTVVAFFDHPCKSSEYDNIVISALAVLGIREDGGWVPAVDYTAIYSAVIKVIRMVVVYQSYIEREDEIAALVRARGLSKEEAQEECEGVFSRVRQKVQRFMTRTPDGLKDKPTPMDWIFDTRTYGMRIRFTEAVGGMIDWQGERLIFRRLQLTMGQLGNMFHDLIREMHDLMARLTQAGGSGTDILPRIEWDRMEDDHSEDRQGYSFLTDNRNTWLEKGVDWVQIRISRSDQSRSEWFTDPVDEEEPFRARAVRQYQQDFRAFRERLWMVMHMTSGQPARTTEISGIRMSNTANGGIRNIFAHRGMVCFVTSYHKGYRSSRQGRVVHRYMAREVGELLVWYMWLVLPFWQGVRGIMTGSHEYSAFLWSDDVVCEKVDHEEPDGSEEGGQDRGDSEGSQDGEDSRQDEHGQDHGFQAWQQEPRWTSDRCRRIVQEHSSRLAGVRINNSAWRHIAIAIANRFFNAGAQMEEEEDEDGIDDNIWDLQAGHGTHVAGMIYARELQQGQFGTAQKRDQYRAISQKWHRFWGLGLADGTGKPSSDTGTKRKREPFEDIREAARFQRFAKLQHINIHGELRMMMGEEATFRGQQRAVIQAIIRGENPIVQVEKTGGGKSLSFMFPAFCSPEGTTIVIVPLVSLQQDLYDRCVKHGITAHTWQSRGSNPAASIIFVTAESAITKGFQDFVNRLQARQMLDRVVVDECHTLPDGQADFRPQLQMVGPVLQEWGVQRVFLTATLAPCDEDEFFHAARISRRSMKMFRARTTRANVAYRVEIVHSGPGGKGQEDEDARVRQIVTRWLNKHAEGKAIVYPGSVSRVKALGEALGCEIYHRTVDTEEGKARRLRSWVQQGKLIVATNALGLGVDIPDVRLVVHAGAPRRMRDYVQESGRAGRDGQPSEAVIVCQKQPATQANIGSKRAAKVACERAVVEVGMEEFIEGKQCRRVVLDRVMDGYFQRTNCEGAEEACDICRRRRGEAEVEDELEATLAAEEEEEEEGEAGRNGRTAIQQRFEHSQRQGQFERWKAQRARMGENKEAADFADQLERWVGCCVVCRISKESNTYHAAEQCPRRESRLWREGEGYAQEVEEEMFKKKRFAEYSGCFHCGFPQAICEGWQAADDDGGRFRQTGKACQYQGLMIDIYGVTLAYDMEWVRNIFQLAAEEDRSSIGQDDGVFKWLGGRMRWGHFETNRMCRVLYFIICCLE